MRELQLKTSDTDYIDVVWVRPVKRPMGGSSETLHRVIDSLPGDVVTLRWVAYGALHTVELPDDTNETDLREIGLAFDSNGHCSFATKAKTSMTYTLLNGMMQSPVAFYAGVRVPLPDLPDCTAVPHLGSSLTRIRLRQPVRLTYGS